MIPSFDQTGGVRYQGLKSYVVSGLSPRNGRGIPSITLPTLQKSSN